MSPRPVIFISAVSRELRSARQLVANTLTFLGYEPEWQDIFSTEEGDLRGMLRRRIDASQGVVQIVGQCYGAEPPTADQQFGRVSYTQYEALYARQCKKKVWYLVLDENFATDPHDPEPEDLRDLQIAYRARLKTDNLIRHSLSSRDALEASVLKLRDDLTRLRRGVKQWAIAVAVLLVVSVGLGVWLLQRQQGTSKQLTETNNKLTAVNEKMDALLKQGVIQFAEVQQKVRQEQPGQQNAEQIQQRTYEELAKRFAIDPKTLQEKLPQFANELKNNPNASTFERANASYVAKDYAAAERSALAAAQEASRPTDAIAALELAGNSAYSRIDYEKALQYFRAAANLIDRTRDPVAWAREQWNIGDVLLEQGNFAEAENALRETLAISQRSRNNNNGAIFIRNDLALVHYEQGKCAEAESEFRDVVKLAERSLGATHPQTLGSRNNLINTLVCQGKYAEAEALGRELIKVEERVLGPENPNTLQTRNNLANALNGGGKWAEAEKEYRDIIRLEDKVLGPDHPNTIVARNNLGTALLSEDRYPEAEAEDREVVKLYEKVLGARNPRTLGARQNLANALACQAKYSLAESEFRDVIKIREETIGPLHPDTLQSCFAVAICLKAQGKMSEANEFARRAAEGARKILGPNDPRTLKYYQSWQQLQQR